MKIYESKGGNRNMLSMLRKKIVAGLLIIAMAFSVIAAPVNTEAAARPKLSYVKTAKVGKSTSITIKNVQKGYYYKITKTTGSVTTTPKVKKATKIYGKTATIKAVSKKPGTYKVTIQVYKNKKAKTKVGKAITATVKGYAVDNTQIELEGASVWVGETTNVKFTVTPSTTKVTFRSENPDIVTIDEEGNVTGVKAGTAVIVAAADQKEARAEVNVVDTTELKLEGTSVWVGETAKLTSTVTPETAKVTFKSENPEVATVDGEGNVTGVKAGTAIIVATSGSKKVTAEVTVEETTDLKLGGARIYVGETTKVVATVTPAHAKVIFESRNPDIATVDAEGNVTAVKVGTAVIVATSGKKEATAEVTVVERYVPVEWPVIDDTEIKLEGAGVWVGETANVKVTVTPSTTKVTFRSENPDIATIDAEGNVTGVKAGTAVIVATSGSKTATATVTVYDTEGLKIELEKASVRVGETIKVLTVVTPETAKVTYKSQNPEIASVDAEGNVTGFGEGAAVIEATSGSKTATANVTVVNKEAEIDKEDEVMELKLELLGEYVYVGETIKIVVSGISETAEVSFESRTPDIATVNAEGIVTGVSGGTATIVVMVDNKEATVEVPVREKEIVPDKEDEDINLRLEEEKIHVSVMGKAEVKVTVTPLTTEVTFESENEGIATVDGKGTVTGIAEGETNIIVRAGNRTVRATVIVDLGTIPDQEVAITNFMGGEEADVFIDG